MIHVFAQYFSASRWNASAMLWMLFAVILLVTLVIIKVSAGPSSTPSSRKEAMTRTYRWALYIVLLAVVLVMLSPILWLVRPR